MPTFNDFVATVKRTSVNKDSVTGRFTSADADSDTSQTNAYIPESELRRAWEAGREATLDELTTFEAEELPLKFDEAREAGEKLRRVVAFFSSVIKSGESWSSTCENEAREALSAWDNLPKELEPEQ